MPPSLLLDVQITLMALALVMPRVAVCLVILPGFGAGTLTGLLRGAVAMALALPAVPSTMALLGEAPPGFLLAAALAGKEVLVGAMLGAILAIPLWVAQSIGSILDAQRSPIQIQANNASLDRDASALGGMLVQAMVLVLIEAGLFIAMTRIIIESYGLWPAYSLTPPFEAGHLDVLIARFGQFMWHVVVYGGPVLIPLLFIDLAFAMIGVFAPGLQVSFASSPIKSLAGLLILLVYFPTLAHYAGGDFARILEFPAAMLQAGP